MLVREIQMSTEDTSRKCCIEYVWKQTVLRSQKVEVIGPTIVFVILSYHNYIMKT